MRIRLRRMWISTNGEFMYQGNRIQILFEVEGVDDKRMKKIDEEIRKIMKERDEEIRRALKLKDNEDIDFDEDGELWIIKKTRVCDIEDGEEICDYDIEYVRKLRRREERIFEKIRQKYNKVIEGLRAKKRMIMKELIKDLEKRMPRILEVEI